MCTNYAAARRDRFFKQFGVEPPESPWRDEVYKDYPAPIIQRQADAARVDVATFGIVPRKHIPPGVRERTCVREAEARGDCLVLVILCLGIWRQPRSSRISAPPRISV